MTDRTDFFIPGPAGRLSLRGKGLAPRPQQIVILVQGANMSGQMGYDFGFDGGSDYSMMDGLVAAGFGALTFSVRGYALSDGPADGFTVQTDAAIEDLAAVVAWARTQGWARPHLLGWSWGGRITGRYAETHAADIDRLVLMDPALGGGQKILPLPTDPWWHNSYAYFIDRLEPEFSDDAAREALARRMDSEEPKAPNGVRLENALGTTRVEPDRVTRPTLMLYGSAAARQNYMQGGWGRLDFYDKLATEDKAYVLVPGCGDYAHLQRPRQRIYQACSDFPARAERGLTVAGAGLGDDYQRAGFGGRLDFGSRPALLVVDVVMAYLDRASPLYAQAFVDALAVNERLVAAARTARVPVVFTGVRYGAQGRDGGLFFRKVPALRCFLDGSPLAAFAPTLQPAAGEVVVVKQYASAFFGTSLAATLNAQRIDTVLVTGFSTSGCVRATALDALQNGFAPFVVAPACGERDPRPHEANLFDLQAKYAEVIDEEQALAYVAGAGRPDR